jgi:hypothetical protein
MDSKEEHLLRSDKAGKNRGATKDVGWVIIGIGGEERI